MYIGNRIEKADSNAFYFVTFLCEKNAEKHKKYINVKFKRSLIKYTKESNSLVIKQLVTVFFRVDNAHM